MSPDPTATDENLFCVRKCLQREDERTHQGKACGGCLTDQEIDDYHEVCFLECRVNFELYPGVGWFN